MKVKRLMLLMGLIALSVVARAEEGLSPDSLAWNEGLAAYQAGDVTNALRVLRPLLVSKTHSARAGELVAKLDYDQAHELGATNMLAHLESAAKAAQIALRANPDDARANANFTRATDGLAELRATTRVNEILAAAEGKNPATQLKGAVTDSRALLTELKRLTEAEPTRQVELADELEKKATRLADVWLPIRDAVSKNVTNEEALAQITGQIDMARDLTTRTAQLAGDLGAGADATAAQAEEAFTGFYKAVVAPPEAIHESLISQTNACAGVEPIGSRSWQGDAVGYTQAFRKRFPQWADAYEQQRQADTNAPPLTAEARAKIEELAEKLEAEQIACCQNPEKERQDKAAALAGEILQLMPVPPQPPPQQDQQNQQQQNQQQNQDQQNRQEQQQQNQQQQDQQEQQQEQAAEAEEKPEEKQQEASEAQEEEKSPEEKEDEALLRRVQERSAEHQSEQRRRAGQRRVTKDW